MTLAFPNIDPVAFSIAQVDVHWYGIAYIAAFFSAMQYLAWQNKRYPSPLTKDHLDNLFIWLVLGVIIGGRLGYTLFYNPSFYFANPVEIFKTWQGGMSYHGGMLGVILAMAVFARSHNVSLFTISDRLAPGVCIGLFLGRIANFINGELYGRVTDVPWAVAFPAGGYLPRHPSQLYEAFLEGVLLFVILHLVISKRLKKGEVSGLFLIGYGLSRFGIEFVRQPDNITHLHEGIFTSITMGQLLSLPMVIVGMLIWNWSRKNPTQYAQ